MPPTATSQKAGPGRPRIYANEEERAASVSESNKASVRKGRTKKRLLAAGQVPPIEIKQFDPATIRTRKRKPRVVPSRDTPTPSAANTPTLPIVLYPNEAADTLSRVESVAQVKVWPGDVFYDADSEGDEAGSPTLPPANDHHSVRHVSSDNSLVDAITAGVLQLKAAADPSPSPSASPERTLVTPPPHAISSPDLNYTNFEPFSPHDNDEEVSALSPTLSHIYTRLQNPTQTQDKPFGSPRGGSTRNRPRGNSSSLHSPQSHSTREVHQPPTVDYIAPVSGQITPAIERMQSDTNQRTEQVEQPSPGDESSSDPLLRSHDSTDIFGADPDATVIGRWQEQAIDALIRSMKLTCPCQYYKHGSHAGCSLRQMATLLQRQIEHASFATHTDAPLSHAKVLGAYPQRPKIFNWRALVTGYGLDPAGPDKPPKLDLDASEEELTRELGVAPNIGFEFDVDSVIFMADSLGVFREDVEWSFRPSYTQSQQQNQYVKFPGIDMMKDKCMRCCSASRWECYIFFGAMPLHYESSSGDKITSRSQHLDDYVMEIWTDHILLPSLRDACGQGRRHHYPRTFREIQTKSRVHSETNIGHHWQGLVDTRIPIAAHMLTTLWNNILARSKHVPNTLLPANAFANPTLVVSNHNLKLNSFSKHRFADVRTAFMADFNARWNKVYIQSQYFWLDLGLERFVVGAQGEPDTGVTLLRKTTCNTHWSQQFASPAPTPHVGFKDTTFPWAGTLAGSIQTNTLVGNPLRFVGLGMSKAYNVIKEQHASQMKGLHPFQSPGLEALSYTKEQLLHWDKKRRSRGQQRTKLNTALILQHLQNSKDRVYEPLHTTDTSNYGDRQESRLLLDLFLALPSDLDSRVQQSISEHSHTNYWVLRTSDVNAFRVAEANRWLILLESIAAVAQPQPGTNENISLVDQELNSLMSTAVARLLRFSLGCLNPAQFPELWQGKRWVKSRFSNEFRNNTVYEDTVYRKRQGLNLAESNQEYGMMWLSPKLGVWGLHVPVFRIQRYPHLDVNVNTIRSSLGISMSALRASNHESKVREYTRTQIEELVKANQPSDKAYIRLCDVLSQLCVQSYNLAVWDEIFSRWKTQGATQPRNRTTFEALCGRSDLSKRGLEVLSIDRLHQYLGSKGAAAVEQFDIAFAKGAATDTSKAQKHFPSWNDASWRGRVLPLFRPMQNPPTWSMKTPYMQKSSEITDMIRAAAGPNAPAYLKTYYVRLAIVAPRYIQAIMNYDYDKAVTSAKASSHNSKSVQAQRRAGDRLSKMKWMFPFFNDQDLVRVNQTNRDPEGEDIEKREAKEIASRWRVPLTTDRKYYANSIEPGSDGYPPKAIVMSGSQCGAPEELTELTAYMDRVEQWVEAEAGLIGSQQTEEEEESDWPQRPGEDINDTLVDSGALSDASNIVGT